MQAFMAAQMRSRPAIKFIVGHGGGFIGPLHGGNGEARLPCPWPAFRPPSKRDRARRAWALRDACPAAIAVQPLRLGLHEAAADRIVGFAEAACCCRRPRMRNTMPLAWPGSAGPIIEDHVAGGIEGQRVAAGERYACPRAAIGQTRSRPGRDRWRPGFHRQDRAPRRGRCRGPCR